MTRVFSFPPIADERAECLVLGSMPGKASLRANQYYAHPRNAFWPIIEALFGIASDLPYDERCAGLLEHRLAVWDVLKTCTRVSSLDSDIDPESIEPNDFPSFLAAHPSIRLVCFNGAMAEQSFRRHVLSALPAVTTALPQIRLPSTSPANATLTFQQKLERWSQLCKAR